MPQKFHLQCGHYAGCEFYDSGKSYCHEHTSEFRNLENSNIPNAPKGPRGGVKTSRKAPPKGAKTVLQKSYVRKNPKKSPKTMKSMKGKGKKGGGGEEEESGSAGEGVGGEEEREGAVVPVSRWKNCVFVEAASTILSLISNPTAPSLPSHPPSLRLGGLTVHSPGRLDHLFSESSPQVVDGGVVPFDYKASRVYWSYKNPGKRCVYLFVTGEREGKVVFTVLTSDCSQALQCEGIIINANIFGEMIYVII